MKSLNRKFFSVALLAGLTLFSACEDDENSDNGGGGNVDGGILSGTITQDVTLTAGTTYRLSGAYTVEEGATLTIEPGVRIVAVYDDIVDYILVKQGARINAEGTASSPIVMTSEQEEAGAWGGIHICGRAHTNAEGGVGSSEIGNAAYGGNDDSDNSGTLRYVRLEYTGYAFDEEHEANGISFYGVGKRHHRGILPGIQRFGRRFRVLRRLGQRQQHGRDRLQRRLLRLDRGLERHRHQPHRRARARRRAGLRLRLPHRGRQQRDELPVYSHLQPHPEQPAAAGQRRREAGRTAASRHLRQDGQRTDCR